MSFALIPSGQNLSDTMPSHMVPVIVCLFMLSMVVNLFSTVGLWVMFLVKLKKLHRLFTGNADSTWGLTSDRSFLKDVIQRQRFLMFWIAISTVLLVAANAVFLGKARRVFLLLDMVINSVMIFLSFSLNKNWYEYSGCSKCAQWTDCRFMDRDMATTTTTPPAPPSIQLTVIAVQPPITSSLDTDAPNQSAPQMAVSEVTE